MAQELIVKSKTVIAKQASPKDILSLYGVPAILDQIVRKEKNTFLKNLSCWGVILDDLNKLTHNEDLFVDIPAELREMLKSGKATFDKSSKNPGGFTPNIRIKGEIGIKGQATIVQKVDKQKITQNMSNLAMLAIVQSIFERLDVIEEKLEDVKKGQTNDRIGSIIGYFKGFMDLYPTFKSSEELNSAAIMAYLNMQGGLAKLHLQIEENRKKLDGAPGNNWQTFWKSIIHPFRNEAKRYQECYQDYVYDIQLYNRLILLSDVVLHLNGDNEAIERNHKIMIDYCEQYIDNSFKQKMEYLMANNTQGITNILDYNRNLSLALDGGLAKDIIIECKLADVKSLNREENESKAC